MERSEDFYDYLLGIYSKEILENFIVKDTQNKKIFFNQDEIDLISFIIKYFLDLEYKKSEQIKCCDKCKSIFGIYFKKRHFEFPNWRDSLDFDQQNAKDIMIIGEAAGPKIKSHLNFSYGLNFLPIEENGRINSKKLDNFFKEVRENIFKDIKNERMKEIRNILFQMKQDVMNNLWQYLYDIFFEKNNIMFDRFLNSVYITDLVKCNLGKTAEIKSNTIWKNCIDNCKENFFKEIKLINPKLILIIADSTFETFKSLLQDKKIKITLYSDINFKDIDFKDYLSKFNSRHFGYFELNQSKIYFFHIFHNKRYYRLEKQFIRPEYKKLNQKFFSEEITPKVLFWNDINY